MGFEIDSIDKLKVEKDSIVKYLECLNRYRDYLQDLVVLIERLIHETKDFIVNYYKDPSHVKNPDDRQDEKLAKKNIDIYSQKRDLLTNLIEGIQIQVDDFEIYNRKIKDDNTEFERLEFFATHINL